MITKLAIQLLTAGIKLFPSSDHAPAGPCDCNLLDINIFITTINVNSSLRSVMDNASASKEENAVRHPSKAIGYWRSHDRFCGAKTQPTATPPHRHDKFWQEMLLHRNSSRSIAISPSFFAFYNIRGLEPDKDCGFESRRRCFLLNLISVSSFFNQLLI